MRDSAPGFPVLKHPVALRLLLGHVVDGETTLAMLRDHVRALAKDRAALLEVRESLRGRDAPGEAFRHPTSSRTGASTTSTTRAVSSAT